MTQPDISVIVPAHNEETAITRTLGSLCAQDYPSREIIVACNGCTDNTATIAANYPGVRVVESPDSGMSFGKNLGAAAAQGRIFVFVDADTTLPPDALTVIMRKIAGKERVIGTLGGRPDRGGVVVRVCFIIANIITRKNRVHAPGGVMVMQREVYAGVGGFDEKLPQGTSSDIILRARAAGAEYVYIGAVKGTTSIRRFEKTGIIRQMLAWRDNHKQMESGRKDLLRGKTYDNVR